MKSRPRDWLDAESIVSRGTPLHVGYILKHLEVLCEQKEEPETLARAERMLRPRA